MTPAQTLTAAPAAGPQPLLDTLSRWPVMLLVCLASVVPLLIVDFPPLADLYGHLGRYAVQTELAQRPALQPFFSYDWKLIGNLGGDIVVEVLHPLLGLEGSVKATVILAQFLGALGLLLVAREVHGRVTPFSVAAITLLYGYPFNYGFLNYTLSMALALLAFALWLRLHRHGRSIAAAVWLGVAGAGIWVAHTYGWAFLCILAGSTMLAEVGAEVLARRIHPLRGILRIVAACWPLLLPIVPMVVWRAESTGAAMWGWSMVYKLRWLFAPLKNVWLVPDIASVAIIATLLYWARLSRTATYAAGLAIAAALCIAFFFILPTMVFGSAFADMRLLPYGIAVALVAVRFDKVPARELAIVGGIALAFFAARQAMTGAAYVRQARLIEAAIPALDHMPRGARVAFFVVKPCAMFWELPALDHLSGIAMARRDAFVNDQWQTPGLNPLTVHYPAAEPFTRDPSHLAQGERCGHHVRPPLSEALARLPRKAFTHVWVVSYEPVDWSVVDRSHYVEIPGSGSGKLFRVVP